MKEKLYSINHVQEMIDISPAELQKMLKKNARVLHLVREDRGNGKKEVFIDEESLQKLIFIRQLENGAPVTDNAVCEIIKVPELNSLKTCSKTQKALFERLTSTLDALFSETNFLKAQLQGLTVKHDHLIKQLNVVQAKNIVLEREVGILRNREAALMGQLRQNAENDDELEIRLVN